MISTTSPSNFRATHHEHPTNHPDERDGLGRAETHPGADPAIDWMFCRRISDSGLGRYSRRKPILDPVGPPQKVTPGGHRHPHGGPEPLALGVLRGREHRLCWRVALARDGLASIEATGFRLFPASVLSMQGSRGLRLAAWAILIALASVLTLPQVVLDTPDRGRAPHDGAAAMSGGVGTDRIDPAVLPQRPTTLVGAAGEHRTPRVTTLLVAALVAAVLALAVSAAGKIRPVAQGTPALARPRNCIGMRAPPSLQLA